MEDVLSIDSQDEGQAPPSGERFSLPPMTVQRASTLIDKFTRDPQFLANPFTKDAANAVLNQAVKVVRMSADLERANNSSESARSVNLMMKQSIAGLGEAGALIPQNDVDGRRELGRLVRIMKSPDADPEDFFGSVAALRAKYVAKDIQPKGIEIAMPDGTKVPATYNPQTGNYRPVASSEKNYAPKDAEVFKSNRDKAAEIGDTDGYSYWQKMMDKVSHVAATKPENPYDKIPPEVKTGLQSMMTSWYTAQFGGASKDGTAIPPNPERAAVFAESIKMTREKYGIGAQAAPTASPAASAPTSAAETQSGQIYKGYKFLGGDRADKNNWQPVQP